MNALVTALFYHATFLETLKGDGKSMYTAFCFLHIGNFCGALYILYFI